MYTGAKLPYGSGFGTPDINFITNSRIEIYSSYAVMNENGFYEGSADFKIVITPSFTGHRIKLVGKSEWPKRKSFSGLEDYLIEVYYDALMSHDEFTIDQYLSKGDV